MLQVVQRPLLGAVQEPLREHHHPGLRRAVQRVAAHAGVGARLLDQVPVRDARRPLEVAVGVVQHSHALSQPLGASAYPYPSHGPSGSAGGGVRGGEGSAGGKLTVTPLSPPPLAPVGSRSTTIDAPRGLAAS